MKKSNTLIALCFFTIYVVWGSTYLLLAFVIEELPPFLTAFLRFAIAAVILITLAIGSGHFRSISKKQLFNAVFSGILMLGIGSGVTTWVLQFLDSGFTALLISAQPLIIVFMMWIADSKRPPGQTFFGVLLGMVGVFLLVNQDEIVAGPDQWYAILALFICMLTWGYGSIYIGKAEMPKSFLQTTGIQFTAGAILTLLISLSLENHSIQWSEVSRDTWYYLALLSIFGSVLAFLAFNYLLKNVTPDKVSTSTYVNPVIAMLLGWWFRDELLTVQSIAAAGIMLSGVVLINFNLTTVKKGLYHILPKRKFELKQ